MNKAVKIVGGTMAGLIAFGTIGAISGNHDQKTSKTSASAPINAPAAQNPTTLNQTVLATPQPVSTPAAVSTPAPVITQAPLVTAAPVSPVVAPAPEKMPNVTGERLDVAKSDLNRAGIDPTSTEVVGGGMFGVVVDSNWTVCSQLPKAGKPAVNPRLVVARTCS